MVDKPAFKMGDYVEKISGSSWRGRVVGTYLTDLTPEGYAVESGTEKGSVQIYPAKALRLATPANGEQVERVAEAAFKAALQYAADEGWAYLPDDLEQAVLAGNAVAHILATLSTPTEDARSRVKVLEEAVATIMARCEALEDEAADELAKDHPIHAVGFYSGQKSTAKSLRRHLHDLTRTALGNKETDRHG